MGDNREHGAAAPPARRIAGYGAVCTTLGVADEPIAFWQVDDLERYVDRHALLAAADPAEPPYWAHCWSGSLVLAGVVPRRPRRVVEIGCGLGLPGLVAARRGGAVVFVDRAPPALAFVRASLTSNRLAATGLVAADATEGTIRGRFDLVLAAEVLYDRSAFAPLADAIAALLAPGGVALLADGHRIDTSAFYALLAARDLGWQATEHRVREEGCPVTVTLATIGHG